MMKTQYLVSTFILLGISITFDEVKAADPSCPSSGISYLPHYSNCSLFFECKDGFKYLMYCPEYYAFNANTDQCEEEDKVDCSYTTISPPTTPPPKDPSCPANGIAYIPHYSDCTLYYKCDDGYKTQEQCEAGYAWSISLEACDFIENVDCSYTTVFPPTTTPSKDPSCPDSGIKFYPNYADCHSFYECDDGYKSIINCADGYAWSVQLEACDFEERVDCSYTTITPPTTTPANECPADGYAYLPNYADCTKFFECRNGQEYARRCPDGYAWSITLNQCDFEDNVDCSYTTSAPVTYTTTNAPTTPDNTCPATGIEYLPDYSDCEFYYQCKDGNKTREQCDDGLAWSIVLNMCDDEDTVDCSYTTTTINPPTTTPFPNECPEEGTSFLPNEFDCTSFYECRDGSKIAKHCPEGFAWDIDKNSCQDSDTVDCSYTRLTSTQTSPITAPETTTPTTITSYTTITSTTTEITTPSTVPTSSPTTITTTTETTSPTTTSTTTEATSPTTTPTTTEATSPTTTPTTTETTSPTTILTTTEATSPTTTSTTTEVTTPTTASTTTEATSPPTTQTTTEATTPTTTSTTTEATSPTTTSTTTEATSPTTTQTTTEATTPTTTSTTTETTIPTTTSTTTEATSPTTTQTTTEATTPTTTSTTTEATTSTTTSTTTEATSPTTTPTTTEATTSTTTSTTTEATTPTTTPTTTEATSPTTTPTTTEITTSTTTETTTLTTTENTTPTTTPTTTESTTPITTSFTTTSTTTEPTTSTTIETTTTTTTETSPSTSTSTISSTTETTTITTTPTIPTTTTTTTETTTITTTPTTTETTTETTTPTTTPSSTTTTEGTTTQTTKGTTLDPFCPYPNKITYHAHPYNCSLYYECRDGLKYLQQCKEGYLWSVILNTCDLAANVDCSYTSVSPTGTTELGVTQSLADFKCNGHADGILLDHPYSCSKFIECRNGQDVVHICPPGTSWDKKMKYCDFSVDNKCPVLFDIY